MCVCVCVGRESASWMSSLFDLLVITGKGCNNFFSKIHGKHDGFAVFVFSQIRVLKTKKYCLNYLTF